MDKFIPDRKNATIIAFDKPINKKLSPNIRTGNMVSSRPLSLGMKYRFEKFDIKLVCLKVFGRLLLSYCLFCYSRKFLKGVLEKFHFKAAMCFQSFGSTSIMSIYIHSRLTLERPNFF